MSFGEHVADSSSWPGPNKPRQKTPGRSLSQTLGNQTPGSQTPGGAIPHQRPLGHLGSLAPNRRSALLEKIVESEILPRLVLARSAASSRTAEPATTSDDTTELVHRLISPDDQAAWALIERLQADGVTAADLYLGIITRAARQLGDLWQQDRCDFTHVTIGLGRLQLIARKLSPDFQAAAVSQSAHADTVLLLPAPGEQHTIGLVILAEFFRREGWNVAGAPVSTGYDAPRLVRGAWTDVVGFSIGSMQRLDQLTTCISAVRKASRNPYLAVLVGGPLLLERPDLVARVGADATAVDAPAAVRQARGLLAMQAAAD
ncbi:cobalamin B12-binding domain-containing protein [Rhodopila sp.]|uniref:cobalamin B12-binding domain-containing protein n=1 Tax=Rhodopila sp. TaxID=2480087 RepID=UPI003D0C504E